MVGFASQGEQNAAPPDGDGVAAPVPGGALLAGLLPGQWQAYRPLPAAGNGRNTVGQAELVRPITFPCPRGTANYKGRAQPYSCLVVFKDNANRGHSVGLRQGRSGETGFGLLHALLDHNVDQETIGTVIVNSAAGIKNGTRFLYGLRFETNGIGLIAVEVIEDRAPSTEAPDQEALGVLTEYCKGLDRCPDWVNQSLP